MSNFKKYLENVQKEHYYNEEEEKENNAPDKQNNIPDKQNFAHGGYDNSVKAVGVQYGGGADVFSNILKMGKNAIMTILTGGKPQNVKEKPKMITRTGQEAERVREYEISINDFIVDIENSIGALKKIIQQNIVKQKDPAIIKKLQNEQDIVDKFENDFETINRQTKFL